MGTLVRGKHSQDCEEVHAMSRDEGVYQPALAPVTKYLANSRTGKSDCAPQGRKPGCIACRCVSTGGIPSEQSDRYGGNHQVPYQGEPDWHLGGQVHPLFAV
jgi:hypothetical protein